MNSKSYNLPIGIVSVAIPLVVIILFYIKPPEVDLGFNVRILPAFHASINFTTAIMLILGYYFIRSGNKAAHKISMLTAFVLSAVFLVSYVIYHTMTEPTRFGGEGMLKYIYYFILVTHILLAVAIVPMVLFSVSRGLQKRFDQHKRIGRWTLPVWLYVAITGVLVYLMIAPYYEYV